MLKRELNKFRKEIERKFASSESNHNYSFPRQIEILEENIDCKPNCNFRSIVVDMISANTFQEEPKIKLEIESKNHGFLRIPKKSKVKLQPRAESKESLESTKKGKKLSFKLNGIDKELALKSIKSTLIKALKSKGKEDSKEKRKLEPKIDKSHSANKFAKSDAFAQKIPSTHPKSPLCRVNKWIYMNAMNLRIH